MEPVKKYYSSISMLGNIHCEKEKRLAALEDLERQILLESSGEKTLAKKPETTIFSNLTNVENLFWTLLSHLESYNETSENFIHVLCLACKHLLKKLKVESHIKIGVTCSSLAEKASAEKNWSVLEKCFKCFKFFENKEWNSVLQNEQRRNRIVKIIHSSISIGKEELCNKNKQEFAVLQILCIEVLSNIIKTEIFKKDEILKPNEWFMLLFPLLFDENCELRKVTCRTFVFLKNQCPDVSSKLLLTSPSLKEQLKISYSKILAQLARTNESDWVDLWCLMVDLLGQECTARKNTELINNLLEAEEIGFRSPNMNTRYNAFVGWKFLVNKFLDTSLEDSTRRLKLLMQPLVTSNSKTMDITIIKFEIWWQLIIGIEPCIEKHAANILYHFLNFCFGPVSDGSATNVRSNSDVLAPRRPTISNSTNYPLVTVRRWRGIEVNRTDALAQILNLNTESNKEYKLQHFKDVVISQPETFLSLSKMLIHCVGECTILSLDCKEMSSQERKFYVRDIWKNLFNHIKRVDKMSLSANDGHDSSERNEKTEMIKNVFRILLRLNEMALSNQQLAYICLNPVLETILSLDNGLSDEVLISRNYYVGTDLMMGTPLLILLDVFLSPACLSMRGHTEDHKLQNEVQYMVLLQRLLHLGVGSSDITILFTQAVMKRVDAAVSNISVEGNKVKSIWIMFARLLTSRYVALGRDINQGTEEKADFSCLISVLMFPVTYSKIFLTDQDMIVRIWSQLYQAFQRNAFSNVQSVVGNEICNTLCGKVHQEICRKKGITSNELLHIMCLMTCAIEQIPFHSVNKILSGNASEGEKLGHLQQCFQLLQTLSTEIQKLKDDDNVYINIVTQYAKCYQVFCDNLKECPVMFLTLFFIEQVQFLLSIKMESNGTSSRRIFSSTCIKTWNSFLNSLLSGCFYTIKQNKQKIVKMIQPALLSSFSHSDHTIHEITINFGVTENIILQTNYECNKCRIMQERMCRSRTSPMFPTCKSPGETSRQLQDLSTIPLTKHQREVFKQRKDDIPALYQDLTQDSQPSFNDSQDLSQLPGPACSIERKPTTSREEIFTSPSSTFQSNTCASPVSKECPLGLSTEGSPTFESALKQLLSDSIEDAENEMSRNRVVKCLDMGSKPKHKDKYSDTPEFPVIKPSETHTAQQSRNEKKDSETSTTHQKTILVIKRTNNNVLNCSTTNAPLATGIKENSSPEGKKVYSVPLCSLSKTSDLRYRSPTDSPHTIKMCISKLKTGNPEVKSIMTNISSVLPERSMDKEHEQSNNKCADFLIIKNIESPKASNNDESTSASNLIEPCVSCPFDNRVTENSSDSLKSSKNNNVSAGIEKSREFPEKRGENTDVISPLNAENFKETRKSPQDTVDQTFTKESCRRNERSPIKETQTDNSSPTTSTDSKVASPARVVLKRLEMNEVHNSTCRALQFKDHDVPKKCENITKEILVKDNIESGSRELTPKKDDLQSCASSSGSDGGLLQEASISDNHEVANKPEKSPRDQLSIQANSPKEVKSARSNCSRLKDVESEFREKYQTRSKTPTQVYQTRSKPLTMYHFTRHYEKRKPSTKTDQNQLKKNSPKENLMETKDFTKRKDLQSVDVVNQKQLKAIKAVQSNLNSSALNMSGVENSTSPKKSPEDEKDRPKENVLEGSCIQPTHLAVEEISHSQSKSPLVNHYPQSSEKMSCEETERKYSKDKSEEDVSKCVETLQNTPESSEEINDSESSKTLQIENKPTSTTNVHCSRKLEKKESPGIEENISKTGKSEEKEQALDDCAQVGEPNSAQGKHELESKFPKSISHYFSCIPNPKSLSPSNFKENATEHISVKDISSGSKTLSESNSCAGDVKVEEERQSVPTSSLDGLFKKKCDEGNDKNELNNGVTEILSSNEVTSQISCDKGEYVRQLSLMPQNANMVNSPKTHRISTRSDWARRFGSKSEVEVPKNTEDIIELEKDDEENTDSSSDMTGSVDSLEYQDFIESSQKNVKEPSLKDCFIQLSKLSIMPGCVLNGVEGCLLVKEEISSGLYKVMSKTDLEEKENQNESNSDKAEKVQQTKESFCSSTIETPESVEKQDLTQEISDTDVLPLPAEQKISLDHKNNEIENVCKPNENTNILKDNCERDTSECVFELSNVKPKELEVIDLTLEIENENTGENVTNTKVVSLNNTVTETENNAAVPERDKEEKRKRKRRSDGSCKNDAKRRRLAKPADLEENVKMEQESNDHQLSEECFKTESAPQIEEIIKLSPSKVANVEAMTNGSPVKMKKSKHLMKPEESSPSRKLLSGRAVQLVGLALTKKQGNNEATTVNPTSEVGTEESSPDVVFYFNAEGQQEKTPWVRHTPLSEASPGRTNLKRKYVEDGCEVTPPKKCVTFAYPEVTKKLHFQKNEIPEKTTFRIVRTKKGKLYVQKNIPATRERHRNMNGSTETKLVWPSLKDCDSPVTSVAEQLAVTSGCSDVLMTALASRNISTVGELCSLSESVIEELPIKAPKVIVFKLVMQAFEDEMKNVENYNSARPQYLQQTTRSVGHVKPNDLKSCLSSMNPAAITDLLKESLSESDLKKVVFDVTKNVFPSSSKSIGVATECKVEDKSSTTDEDAFQLGRYFLSNALNKQTEQIEKNKLINEALQILFHQSNVSSVMKEVHEVVGALNCESANESESEHVDTVNQCFKLLRFFCTKSALPQDNAREFYLDCIKQFGVNTVVSDMLKCGEAQPEPSVFIQDIVNCIKVQLCAKQETAATVFQNLVTDDTVSLAIQHFTAKQLIPHVVNQYGDLSVLDTVLSNSSVSLEKAFEIVAKHLSPDDVDEMNWLNTIFKMLCSTRHVKKKRDKLTTVFDGIFELSKHYVE